MAFGGKITYVTRVVPGLITPEALRRNVTANPDFVKVGLPDVAHQDSNLTIAEIGMIHEFGAPRANIPERPFLIPAIIQGAGEITELQQQYMRRVQLGTATKAYALSKLGELGVRLVQQNIRHGYFKALKPATIRRKGSSKPLIDSQQMIRSVTYELA
jgi:hypothetical protein